MCLCTLKIFQKRILVKTFHPFHSTFSCISEAVVCQCPSYTAMPPYSHVVLPSCYIIECYWSDVLLFVHLQSVLQCTTPSGLQVANAVCSIVRCPVLPLSTSKRQHKLWARSGMVQCTDICIEAVSQHVWSLICPFLDGHRLLHPCWHLKTLHALSAEARGQDPQIPSRPGHPLNHHEKIQMNLNHHQKSLAIQTFTYSTFNVLEALQTSGQVSLIQNLSLNWWGHTAKDVGSAGQHQHHSVPKWAWCPTTVLEFVVLYTISLIWNTYYLDPHWRQVLSLKWNCIL